MTNTTLTRLKDWAGKNPINRPPIKALDRIEAIVQDTRDAEESLRFLRKRLADEVRNVRESVKDDQELSAIANYIYWMVPEVSSIPLIEGIEQRKGASPTLLHKWVKPIPIACTNCGAKGKVRCQSRDDLDKLLTGEIWHFVCADCRVKENEGSRAHQEESVAQFRATEQARLDSQASVEQAKREAQEKRLWELRRMPYAQYLQTPEWKERRARHLESVGHRCQLCNASGELRIHHRNYERRGQELFQDVVVLCRNCHEHFHKGEP